MNCTGQILECGSGLTTVIAGVLAERQNVSICSLEQDAVWAERVEQTLKDNSIDSVTIKYAPLRQYQGFAWYDINALDLPKKFELVVCDGPAVFQQWGNESFFQWRYGLLPVLGKQSVVIKKILLDDVDDPRSQALLSRWQLEFGTTHHVIHSEDGDCALIDYQT